MADTHGLLRPEVERILETCDVIIHAGDFDNQMLYHKLGVSQPLYAVRGNNDRGWAGGLPLVKRFEIGGVKFIMAHERVDIPGGLGEVQVAVFGHSHMYFQQVIDGRLWLNPGSCGYKRFTLPLSMAVMTIEAGAYEVETIWLEKGRGTPGAAKEELQRSGPGKYEKQQRRYREKTGKKEKTEKQSGILPPDAGGQNGPDGEREGLFLSAKILRLARAGVTREWVVRNLGPEYKQAGAIYDLCEKHPGFHARQIWALEKERQGPV